MTMRLWKLGPLLLALCCLWFGAAAEVADAPHLTHDNLEEELPLYRHAFVLFYDSTDEDDSSIEATQALSGANKAFRWSEEVLVAGVDVSLSDNRDYAEAMGVSSFPSLKYFQPRLQKRISYKGGLSNESALLSFIRRKSKIQPNKQAPKTIQGLQSTFDRLHQLHHLASLVLDTPVQNRSSLLGEFEKAVNAILALPYGAEHKQTVDDHLRLANTIISKEWGRSEITKEISRLRKVAETQKRSAKMRTQNKLEMLESYISPIPKVVHFIKTDGRTDRFDLLHYLAVLSAHHWIKPDKIIFHITTEPNNEWWHRCKHLLTIKYVTPPYEIKGKPLRLAAHQSDFLRLNILIQQGGIYMDWDVLSTKSFDSILSSPAVMAVERRVENFNEVLGVAVMMSRPKSVWMKRFLAEMEVEFDGERCYACHSTGLGRRLAMQYPEQVNVLNYTSFYHPGWDEGAVLEMFDPAYYKPGSSLSTGHGLAIHMFESHKNFQEIAIPKLNLDYIMSVDSLFNVEVRKYFMPPYWSPAPRKSWLPHVKSALSNAQKQARQRQAQKEEL